MRRRLLIVLLLGAVMVGAVVAWQARAQARLVERDLTTARDLLTQAGGFSAGQVDDRLVLVDRAEAHTLAAQRRLGSLLRAYSVSCPCSAATSGWPGRCPPRPPAPSAPRPPW